MKIADEMLSKYQLQIKEDNKSPGKNKNYQNLNLNKIQGYN